MRRALFIAIIALTAVSCNDSGGNNSTTDSTGTDTITNLNNTTETPLNDTTMNNMGSGVTDSPGSTGNGHGTDSSRH